MAINQQEQLITHKVTTIVSLALSIYGNLRYLVGRSPFDSDSPFNVSNTPFSSNILVTLIYWGILYFLQIVFVSQIFIPAQELARARVELSQVVGWHFTIFNFAQFIWSMLFARRHFIWSEIVLFINFFNILSLYYSHKTYSIKPLSNWILIHLPTTALPLSWLFYAIFWNGAVMFHIHKFAGRVVCNVLIWDFLIVPAMFILFYNDYGVGFSSSVLMFGLGLGQLLTKAFALQWIFAFVIASILLVLSLTAAVAGSYYVKQDTRIADSEAAPLLSN